VTALYTRLAWGFLATAIDDAWARRDGSGLLALADVLEGRRDDGTYDNSLDAYTSITCADGTAARDPAVYLSLADELAQVSPLFGPWLGLEPLACAFWPVPAASRYAGPFAAPGAPPILVVGTTGDPATPYAWSRSLAAQLESGVLLTWRGKSHTAYFESGCAVAAVDEYLIELRPPRDGAVCSD
jgi:hypothetical protein